VFDTPGQEKSKTIIHDYVKQAQAVVFVYDITNKESFNNIQNEWLQLAKDKAPKDALYFLVGNKADMDKDDSKRQVTTKEAQEFAKKNKMQFFEVSAQLGTKINELFEAIANACAGKAIKDVVDSVNNKINNKNSTLKDSKEPEKKRY
jgi:Ras-related protein Rab-1A